MLVASLAALFVILPHLAISAPVVSPVARATRSAQCRAMCLDEFEVEGSGQHRSCAQKEQCLSCWEKCSSLLTEDVFLEWRSSQQACPSLPECDDPGCQLACQFHQQQQQLTDLADPVITDLARSRDSGQLQVSFGWSEIKWSIKSGSDLPPSSSPHDCHSGSSVVYLLLARAVDDWKELVQTAETGVVLINLEPGTLLLLLAVTSSGRQHWLTTTYWPTAPPHHTSPHQQQGQEEGGQMVLDIEQRHMVQRDGDTSDYLSYQIETPGAWLLETVSVSRDSNMALAEVSWQPQLLASGQYLVTWEVGGGGITGHLYTDLTSVTLSLWPDTVYHIQVEVVRPEEGVEQQEHPSLSDRQLRSVPLVISTHFSSRTLLPLSPSRHSRPPPSAPLHRRPLSLPLSPPLVLLLVALCPALVCAVHCLTQRHCSRPPSAPRARPPRSLFVLAPGLKQKLVAAPFHNTHNTHNTHTATLHV